MLEAMFQPPVTGPLERVERALGEFYRANLLFNSSRVYMASVKQSANLHQVGRGLLNPDKALIPAIKY